jgi:hypothetical protein
MWVKTSPAGLVVEGRWSQRLGHIVLYCAVAQYRQSKGFLVASLRARRSQSSCMHSTAAVGSHRQTVSQNYVAEVGQQVTTCRCRGMQ